MTNTQENRINQYFTKFLKSTDEFKAIKLKEAQKILYMEYDSFFIDDYDTTGWIYFKPTLSKQGRLYMFKGKPYQPLYWKTLKWWHLSQRFQRFCAELHYKYIQKKKPDYAKRHLAEWHIIKNCSLVYLLLLLVAGGYLIYTTFHSDNPEPITIQSEQNVEQTNSEDGSMD